MPVSDVVSADVLLAAFGPELSRFGRFLINGIVVGSILALAGVGLTLVYGILRIANFAHGDFLTLGAYLTLYFVALISIPQTLGWGMGIAVVLVALVAMDRWLRPWIHKSGVLHGFRRDARHRGPKGEAAVQAGPRAVLSPTESRMVLLAALVLVALVAGIRFPLSLSAGVSLLVVVAIAAAPVAVAALRRLGDEPGLARTFGVCAGLGFLSVVAAHWLVPIQTGPGGFAWPTELALGVGVFAGALVYKSRALGRGPSALAGFVAGLVVLAFLFAHPVLLAMVIALAGVAVFLVVLEVAVWRRARRQGAGLLTLIIIAIGLMLALRNFIIIVWGTSQRSFPGTLQPREPILGSALGITPHQALAVAVTLVVILLMHLFLRYTKIGKAMRALADDMELARISGIDVDRVVIYVWIIAGVLAVIAGTLYGMIRPFDTNLGWFQVLPIFAAVILGGIGSPYGAMFGGFTIGIVMEVSPFFGVPIDYKLVTAFAILILVMVFRPKGIMGGGATR